MIQHSNTDIDLAIYQHKLSKYKKLCEKAYMDQKGGDNGRKSNNLKDNRNSKNSDSMLINELVIYHQIAQVAIRTFNTKHPLLPGFIADTLTSRNFEGDFNDLSLKKPSENLYGKKVTVIVEIGPNVKGIVSSITNDTIHLHNNDGQAIIIRKWLRIILEDSDKQIPNPGLDETHIVMNVPGTLQYLTRNITWTPIYDLYLDSDPIVSSTGILSLAAKINNEIGDLGINIDKCILLAGDISIETQQKYRTFAKGDNFMLKHAPEEINHDSFDEMQLYDIGHQSFDGQMLIRPLNDYNIKAIRKKYLITIDNNSHGTNINANYGYVIDEIGADLPAGLLRIYAKSKSVHMSLLLGSVQIPRTSASDKIEAMIGTTSKIRARIVHDNLTEQVNRRIDESNPNESYIYIISNSRFYGKIYNDYPHETSVILRYYLGPKTIIDADPKPIKKGHYLEWRVDVQSGVTPVDLHFMTQHLDK